MENNSVIKKGGHWALVVGVLYIPAAFIVGMFGLMSGFLLDSPGSENLWYVKAIFFLCLFIHPLMCVVASVASFVYHFKNKYNVEAPTNKFLIKAPAIYFTGLLALLIISPFVGVIYQLIINV